MDDKTLHTLEYAKVLEKVANHAAFGLSAEKARHLRPTSALQEAIRRQQITREARMLLEDHPISVGGVRDVRSTIGAAQRGMILTAQEILDIQFTLVAARDLLRAFERFNNAYPHLAEIAGRLPKAPGLVDAVTRAISESGNILDTASPQLQKIRSEIRVTHDRLLSRLQHMLNDPNITPYLQESLITQREGRYVIPIKAEHKGKIKAVVHDQSASGVTLFIEPLNILEINNQHRELQMDEHKEEQRILAALTGQIVGFAEQILQTAEICAQIDLAFACAKYAQEIKASEPVLKPRQPARDGSHPGITVRLWQARHPLLDEETVVPVDIELDPQTYCMVITGPNTGGKTVCLKTIGLFVLMAQSGLQIPAQPSSELSVFHNLFADIGDEQSIEQSLSTFSGHIKNIIHILLRADARSLVILDELGAGTDPQEGAVLARAILSFLLSKRVSAMVTTHHPELKAFAHATPGVTNAAVEFDLESMRPTYRLMIGIPGKSNALAIAQRLGLPEEIISSAREQISPAELRADDLLEEIHRQRDKARIARNEAEKSLRETEIVRKELSRRMEQIDGERREILEKTRAESEEQIRSLREELERIQRKLRQVRQPQPELEEIREDILEAEEALEDAVLPDLAPLDLPKAAPLPIPADGGRPRSGVLRIGAKVFLKALGAEGLITDLNEEEAEVQVGMMRMRSRLSMLEVIHSSSRDEPEPEAFTLIKPASEGIFHASPGVELDLRGLQVEEALERLERYLESAYLAGLPYARIIHGKGTGKLRVAVRRTLGRHPVVTSHENGREGEGGDGVTVVRFNA